jgi:hypothetical protein
LQVQNYFPKNGELSTLKGELRHYRIGAETRFSDPREEAVRQASLESCCDIYHHVPFRALPKHGKRRGLHFTDFLFLDLTVQGKALAVEPHFFNGSEIKSWQEYYKKWHPYLHIVVLGSYLKEKLERDGVPVSTFCDEYHQVKDIMLMRGDHATKEEMRRLKEYVSEKILLRLLTDEGENSVGWKLATNLAKSKRFE